MKKWIALAGVLLQTSCLAAGSQRVSLSDSVDAGESYMRVRLLGAVRITTPAVDGESVSELSGLAWDEDEKLLYAVSDKGALFHLKPRFRDGLLDSVSVLRGFPLRDRHGKKLKGKKDDSEGLDIINGHNGIRGDSELVISFEVRPRIKRFSTEGRQLGGYKLPEPLKSLKNYRASNKALEAVALHPRFGILTTPEASLKTGSPLYPIIYSLGGKQWRLPDRDTADTAIVGLDTLPDGSLLTLSRSYSSLVEPVRITLDRVWLDQRCEIGEHQPCRSQRLASFNSAKGWSIDNFEGVAKRDATHFFIISDNNNFWLQRTLLSYFEILPDASQAKDRP